MWQVAGSNETTYDDRVELTSYYVRNWSPWLDIYVFSRTFLVVLTGEEAYYTKVIEQERLSLFSDV